MARYSTDLDATRAAVHDVLAVRWLKVGEVGSDGFTAGPECRTANGDACPVKHGAWSANAGGDGSTADNYGFAIAARVVPTDGGAIVRIGARLERNNQVMEVGKGEVPAWVQHEIDGLQAEIAHKLAPVRGQQASL